jgi:hypothetical protein
MVFSCDSSVFFSEAAASARRGKILGWGASAPWQF